MADISMCLDDACPSRNICHRFTAKPWEGQSYMDFKRHEMDLSCEHFWPVEEEVEVESRP